MQINAGDVVAEKALPGDELCNGYFTIGDWHLGEPNHLGGDGAEEQVA